MNTVFTSKYKDKQNAEKGKQNIILYLYLK